MISDQRRNLKFQPKLEKTLKQCYTSYYNPQGGGMMRVSDAFTFMRNERTGGGYGN